MQVTVDVHEINRLERDLRLFNERGIGFAAKDALNDAAYNTMVQAKGIVGKNMVLRNTWTRRNISFNRASTRTMQSEAGVNKMKTKDGRENDYMEDQEFGGIKNKRHKHGVAIPTSFSTGEGNAKPRRKVLRQNAKNRLSNIKQLAGREKKWKHQRQANIVAIKQAQRGKPTNFAFLKWKNRRGIVKVTGTKRKIKINMVHDLTRKSVKIPKSPWLTPAYKKILPQIPRYYQTQLQRQIDRLGIFK